MLTKDDIEKIEEILRLHSVDYRVSINEELINFQTEDSKKVLDYYGRLHLTNALFNLFIDRKEFEKIPFDDQKRLEKFNIYPELSEIPFHAETDKIDSPFEVLEKESLWNTRIFPIIALLIILFLAFIWVDKYVIQIFPSPSSSYRK